MDGFIATLITIVIHTPIWVWPLYGLLLFLGLQRTQDSIIPLWRMLMLPIIVTLLAILSIILAGLSAVPAALLGLVMGSLVGWHLERSGSTRRRWAKWAGTLRYGHGPQSQQARSKACPLPLAPVQAHSARHATI